MADNSVDSVSLQCEQRIVIKFLAKEGTPVVKIVKRLKAVFSEDTLSISTIYEWAKRFKVEVQKTALLLMMISELERHMLPCWVSKMLTEQHTQARVAACQQLLHRFSAEGETLLERIVTGD